MMDPCFTAMLEGAVVATNPPAGFTAVPQDGTSASTAINAILAALGGTIPDRNVLFLRPSAQYKINARLDITVDGTAILCGGNAKITLKNTSSSSRDTENPWFRGSGLSPHVRMDDVEHCLWHGGGIKGRDSQSGGGATQTFCEMGNARFCRVSNVYNMYCENILQVAGLSGGVSEFCALDDCHWWQGDTTRPVMRFGATNIRSFSGSVRCCGQRNTWCSGGSNGPIWAAAADDCFSYAGYSEGHGGGAASIAQAGAQRVIWIGTNVEGSVAQQVEGGASWTSIGHTAWGTGSGDIYVFGH